MIYPCYVVESEIINQRSLLDLLEVANSPLVSGKLLCESRQCTRRPRIHVSVDDSKSILGVLSVGQSIDIIHKNGTFKRTVQRQPIHNALESNGVEIKVELRCFFVRQGYFGVMR
jgi:hypothetical protein